MTIPEKLALAQQRKSSLLCIGLDSDVHRIPPELRREKDALLRFNRAIIEATADIAAAYKLNTAFYEQYGAAGFRIMEETLRCIPADVVSIADAKRGDIGNTSGAYARAFLQEMDFDAITVNPYMGLDSVGPFLEVPDKFVFLLALTSNPGSADFQRRVCEDGKPLYLHVLEQSATWADTAKLGYVVGATHPEELAEIRTRFATSVFLIPGVGAQGGDVDAIIKANAGGAALINSSRSIIYASSAGDFASAARRAAERLRESLNKANAS